MEGLDIREGTLADVLPFRRAAAAEHVSLGDTAGPCRWFLAHVDGEIVGFAALLILGHRLGRLRGDYVVPAWRGRGVGSALLEWRLDAARALGLEAVDAFDIRWPRYSRHGFVDLGRRRPNGAVHVRRTLT